MNGGTCNVAAGPPRDPGGRTVYPRRRIWRLGRIQSAYRPSGTGHQGAVVVIDLKRSDSGRLMDLQAIRYAAMVADMTFRQATLETFAVEPVPKGICGQ